MINIFAMNETYKESCAANYTRKYFVEGLQLASASEYRTMQKHCKRLCSITFKEFPRAPMKRFEYLQFLYYVLEKEREFWGKQRDFSIFDCVENPSERHLSVYTTMIKEIRNKVSEATRKTTDSPSVDSAEAMRTDAGRYDASIHDLQQRADLIAQTLNCAYDYGPEALEILKQRERLFYKEMDRLETKKNQKSICESCWDELYLRLNYIRCIYWEKDLLSSYQEVEKIAQREGKKYFAMRKEESRMLVKEDYTQLLSLNEATGEIEEVLANPKIFNHELSQESLDLYITALQTYAKSNVEELARKTFCKQEITHIDKNSITNHINRACEYLKIELQRYGRNANVSKAKFISALQVVFLSHPSVGLAPAKKETTKAQTPHGLLKEKNTLSSSFSNSNEKDPYYLQVICIWINYQFSWNAMGTFFAQKHMEISISMLKAMLAADFRYGMANFQFHAEKVLLAAMRTLIPDEDGSEQVEDFTKALQQFGFQEKMGSYRQESLLEFGKFCKLFGFCPVLRVVQENLTSKKLGQVRTINLNEATDNSVRIHSLMLQIHYYEPYRVYEIQRFFVVEPNDF